MYIRRLHKSWFITLIVVWIGILSTKWETFQWVIIKSTLWRRDIIPLSIPIGSVLNPGIVASEFLMSLFINSCLACLGVWPESLPLALWGLISNLCCTGIACVKYYTGNQLILIWFVVSSGLTEILRVLVQTEE